MCCLGVFKRVVPFLLTFTVGLFIASFFITIAAPSFGGGRRFRAREWRNLQVEVQELKNERSRLKQEIETLKDERREIWGSKLAEGSSIENFVPPPPVAPTVTRPAVTRTLK